LSFLDNGDWRFGELQNVRSDEVSGTSGELPLTVSLVHEASEGRVVEEEKRSKK
jgi:hypothetical protein